MTHETQAVTGTDALRVIAHPARIRLYELLAQEGPMTVSRLADRASLAVGSASYHLGLLHRAGFVAETTGPSGNERGHWWEAVPGGLQWSPADFLDSPGGRQASTTAQRALTQRRVERLGHWQNTWQQWSREWIEAANETDSVLDLTPGELARLTAELHEVIDRWRGHGGQGTPQEGGGDRRSVFLLLAAFPFADEEPRR